MLNGLYLFHFLLSFSGVPIVNNVTTSPGTTAMFFCDASGSPDLTYQWSTSTALGAAMQQLPGRFDGRSAGFATPNLTISEVTSSDSGSSENATVLVCGVSLNNGPVIASARGSLIVLRKNKISLRKHSVCSQGKI